MSLASVPNHRPSGGPATRPVAASVPSGLARDLDLLDVLAGPHAGPGGLGVVRIATLAGREKSQVSRALAALAEQGIVERDPDTQAYRLGWRLYALASRTLEARLLQQAQPHLRRLVGTLHETVHLCVLRGVDVFTLLSEAPAHGFRAVGWDGVVVPAPRTSAGRVLISDWEPDVVRQRYPAEQLAAAPRWVKLRDHESLIAELARVRRRGYAIVDEELEPGLVGASAPVRDFRGRVIAAINVSAPKPRLGDRLETAGRLLAAAATDLSASLGG